MAKPAFLSRGLSIRFLHACQSDFSTTKMRLRRVIGRNKFLCIVFAAVLVLRYFLVSFGHIVNQVDTGWYSQRAQAPLWNLISGYYQGKPFMRPLSYPLLLKLCHFRQDQIPASGGSLFQARVLISILALGAAGLVGCRLYQQLVPRIAWLAAFFAFSLSAFIFPWEPVALTEGVACNGVNFLQAMMFLLACPVWGLAEAILTAFFATAVIFLKDANSFFA